MHYFDPMYFVFIAPALALSLWASWRTKASFTRYSRVAAATGLSGAQAAERILEAAGVQGVKITRSRGLLSDHYNPVTRTLALSEGVYASRSIAAIGVAAHEAGHAIQHSTRYTPLWLRSALVPTANLGSNLGYLVMLIGLFIHPYVVGLGAALFSVVVLFQLVTLPVELDASARAKRLVVEYGIVTEHERTGMDRVLNAAALTYVAAAVSSLLTLLYFLMRSGLIGGGDD
jgi:Zn-dependent membrane protease YugP